MARVGVPSCCGPAPPPTSAAQNLSGPASGICVLGFCVWSWKGEEGWPKEPWGAAGWSLGEWNQLEAGEGGVPG